MRVEASPTFRNEGAALLRPGFLRLSLPMEVGYRWQFPAYANTVLTD